MHKSRLAGFIIDCNSDDIESAASFWGGALGMDVPDAKRLRSLEEENRKLKKLLAESMLDQAALKELLTKKW